MNLYVYVHSYPGQSHVIFHTEGWIQGPERPVRPDILFR